MICYGSRDDCYPNADIPDKIVRRDRTPSQLFHDRRLEVKIIKIKANPVPRSPLQREQSPIKPKIKPLSQQGLLTATRDNIHPIAPGVQWLMATADELEYLEACSTRWLSTNA